MSPLLSEYTAVLTPLPPPPRQPEHLLASLNYVPSPLGTYRHSYPLPLQLERLLASHAFALPVTRAEAADAPYSGIDSGGSGIGGGGDGGDSGGFQGGKAVLPSGGGSQVGYTRSGDVLGGGGGVRRPGVSSQVRDRGGGVLSGLQT